MGTLCNSYLNYVKISNSYLTYALKLPVQDFKTNLPHNERKTLMGL